MEQAEDERAAMGQLAPEWVYRLTNMKLNPLLTGLRPFTFDKLDMALQAKVYMERSELDLDKFIDSARKTLGDHELLR